MAGLPTELLIHCLKRVFQLTLELCFWHTELNCLAKGVAHLNLKKLISLRGTNAVARNHQRVSGDGPYEIKVGAGTIAFSGADTASRFYPGKTDVPENPFTYILNVAQQAGPDRQDGIVTICSLREPDTKRYREIADSKFGEIDAELKRGGRVLIHCSEGLVRSGTLIMMFLVERGGNSKNDASRIVRSLNGRVNPHIMAVLDGTAAGLSSIAEDD